MCHAARTRGMWWKYSATTEVTVPMVPGRLAEAPDSRELDHHSDSIDIAAHEGTQPRRHMLGQTRIYRPILRHAWYIISLAVTQQPEPQNDSHPCVSPWSEQGRTST